MRQWLLIVILLVTGCGDPTVLDAFAPGNELVVITRNGPTTYYLGANEPAGLEYELFKEFATSQEMTLRIKVATTIEDVFDTLARGEAHIAAAGLTQSIGRDQLFTSTRSYLEQHPIVVYKAGQFRPRTIKDLGNLDIVIMQGSHHGTRLGLLAEMDPNIEYRVLETAQSSAVLREIETDRADVALLDSSEFSMQQRLYPRVAKAFQLKETLRTVWYLGLDARADAWRDKIDEFLAQAADKGRLADLEEQYFGSNADTSRIALFTFQRAVESTLPKWRPLIESVAKEFRLDWQLLAAIAYQESHWNPKAKSPTGVRGMMMLTRPTAQEVGVKDRLDAEQSLRGGARFLRNLLRRLPNDIEEPDRTWMALAAYNVGMAHLEEARRLTEGNGGDPHLWKDVRERLPDLQKPEIYPYLRHGFARGGEAVTYVDNIRHYQATLALQDIPSQTISAPIDLDQLTAKAHELLQWKPLSL